MTPPRISRRVAVLAALALSLAAAAPAAADSIAYIKAGDVWLATPDGSRQVQVTHSGGYSSVSQADDGTMVALAPHERLHKLSRSGKVLADFPTYVSDGAEVSGPVNKFMGPFDPQISPDGRLVAFEWYNNSYDGGASSDCQQAQGCYTTQSRKGVGITYSDRLTGPGEFGMLTGWGYPDWISDDVLLRSWSGTNMSDDAVFNRIGPGKADGDLDRWFYDPEGQGTVYDVELSRDRRSVVALAGNEDQLLVYRPLMDPFGAPDWEFSFFETSNTPLVEFCYVYTKPLGGKFTGIAVAPDSRHLAYAVGNGIWVSDIPDLSSCKDARPTVNELRIPDGTSPDWGPADLPGAASPDPAPSGRARLSVVGRPALRMALARGLVVRADGVADGAKVRAARGGRVVAAGAVRGAVARLRFTAAARRSLRAQRRVRLVVSAAGARATVTLRRR